MDFKVRIITILTIAILFLLNGVLSAAEKKNVLILNSYHQGYKWTDDVVKGAMTGLYPLSDNIKIFIEYMGTKWAYTPEYFDQLRMMYKQKYRNTKFDVIISSDDDAFNFLKEHRKELFGDVPMVFCGVNWIKPERFRDMKLCTGINEDGDMAANFDLMLRLHPRTENIYVIIDATTTGQVTFNKVNEIIPQYSGRVKFHILYNPEMKTLLEQLSNLDRKSLVLITVFQKDAKGEFFEYKDSCSMVSRSSSVPVYGLWDFNLGSGIVGGILCSGYSQGIIAGKMSLRILKGEPAGSIQPVMVSPNIYMFDYIQMKRFGMKIADIPSDSVIINKPSSFYSINKQIVWAIIAVLLIMAATIVLLILNIRRRYLAEKTARESEYKYHSLVDSLNVGIVRNTADERGTCLQVNPATMKIFGYDSPEEFVKVPSADLYQDPQYRKNFIEELTRAGSLKDRELPMRKKDGTPIWISINSKAQFDESGRMQWIDSIIEDISEKKSLEDKLRHAQKMEAIGTLASGIAHDFNNALGGLVGVLSIIDRKLEAGIAISEDKTRQYVSIMKESSDKAASMVQRLLTLARKKDAEFAPADLNDIIRRVIELLSGAIDKSVNVIPHYVNKKAAIMADAAQVEQALLNLCINAGHAMTIMKNDRTSWGGDLSISIEKVTADRYFAETHPEASEKEYWIVSVSDTGVGMTADVLSKIYDPFFTTKEEELGTGLGLAMVKAIIRDHSGFIDIYSEYGTGTTFKVYVPVSNEKPEIPAPVIAGELPCGTGLILVVDDESVIRETAREILEECGYTVITADNGETAVGIYMERVNEISAVVMDMAMPVKSGIVAYREMRIINPAVRVLIASGFRQDKRVQEVISMGVAGFIEKPYTLERLGQALKDIIKS